MPTRTTITSRSLSVGQFTFDDEPRSRIQNQNLSTPQKFGSSQFSPSISLLKGSLLDERTNVPTRSPMTIHISHTHSLPERSISPFKRRPKSLKDSTSTLGRRRSLSPLARMTRNITNEAKIKKPNHKIRHNYHRIVRQDSSSDMTAETDDVSVSTSETSRDRRRDSIGFNQRVSSKILPVLSETFNDILENDDEKYPEDLGIETQLISSTQSTRQIELIATKRNSHQRSRMKQNRTSKARNTKAKKENLDRYQTPPALRSRLSGMEMARMLNASNRSSAVAVKHLEDTKHGLVNSPASKSKFYSFAYKKIVSDGYAAYVNTALEKFAKSIGYSS